MTSLNNESPSSNIGKAIELDIQKATFKEAGHCSKNRES
ncbi:MAG: hypothetical protein JSC188_000131 [Candidatus Tokpelaia sp. JSC188]|nr:MAG: hypothetical protein JSC188_000131 [Candidatus Tokpelaia sp. JSC188]